MEQSKIIDTLEMYQDRAAHDDGGVGRDTEGKSEEEGVSARVSQRGAGKAL